MWGVGVRGCEGGDEREWLQSGVRQDGGNGGGVPAVPDAVPLKATNVQKFVHRSGVGVGVGAEAISGLV